MPTNLHDLPTEILAQIHYKSIELMRKDVLDTWRHDFEFDLSDQPAHQTEEEIDLHALKMGLWGFFRFACKMYVPVDEVEALGHAYATGWDEYEWYTPAPYEDSSVTSETAQAEICEGCGAAFHYDGFINPTLCDHCSYQAGPGGLEYFQ